MSLLIDELARRLDELAGGDLRRALRNSSGIDFSSNDYLGLGADPAFADAVARRVAAAAGDGSGLAAPASRLLRGDTRRHRELERRFAAFKGTEDALLFPSGYQANVGLLSALLGPDDRALSDERNHASLIDGLRLARCRKVIYPHLDLAAVEEALATPHPGGRTFLVTESLFSMDGDAAPLDRYAELAERHGAALIVDDAHATGIYGERGSGLAERFGVARRAAAVVSTGGKALAAAGAFVAGPAVLVDFLVNRCRSFIFSTAASPLVVLALEEALDRVVAEPERRRRVLARAGRLRSTLVAAGLDCGPPPGPEGEASPIVPVILEENRRALEVADRLQAAGFDVRAIRPPTVAPGSARLRISVHADHSEETLDRLARAIVRAAGGAEGEPAPATPLEAVGEGAP